jgi:hypothetical protein
MTRAGIERCEGHELCANTTPCAQQSPLPAVRGEMEGVLNRELHPDAHSPQLLAQRAGGARGTLRRCRV